MSFDLIDVRASAQNRVDEFNRFPRNAAFAGAKKRREKTRRPLVPPEPAITSRWIVRLKADDESVRSARLPRS
jgi:hypothetical protein